MKYIKKLLVGVLVLFYRAQNEAYKEVNGEKQRKTLPVKELCVMAASGRAKRNVYIRFNFEGIKL